ncbi:hypothetical protein [Rhodococcus sp. NPDC057529]|uniref:hypothetical protein n=1 Tax=Rhodococcus sp. NPDC057529 TaxID=3346158 RepID=UPI00366CAD2E
MWDWTTDDVWSHIARHQLPANPVYATLRGVGVPAPQHRITHLVDGNHLDRGRLSGCGVGGRRSTRSSPIPCPGPPADVTMHVPNSTDSQGI